MAKLSLTSDLKRKQWVAEKLLEKAPESHFAGLIGGSANSVVHRANNAQAKAGHTVVFDAKGDLSNKPVFGDDQSTGKGETKRKYSQTLTVDRYRAVVKNETEYDAVDAGDLTSAVHSSGMESLSRWYTGFKDQTIFDTLQGNLGTSSTHEMDLTATLDYNALLTLETAVKTGRGFSTGADRMPLTPVRLKGGRAVWLFMVDADMAKKLKQSSNFQTVAASADVRGEGNMLLNGVIGTIGNLMVMEVPNYFGETDSGSSWSIKNVGVEYAGLRQYDNTNSKWSGQTGFDSKPAGDLLSYGVILGANAVQLGMGKAPEYKFNEETLEGTSESQLETWMGVQKTNYTLETGSVRKAKQTALDYGIIRVKLKVN
jgi:N4-gp56 family major capsid protein